MALRGAYALMGQSENTLTFTRQMDLNQQFWTTLALGNAYSSQPVLIATCTLIPLDRGNATRAALFLKAVPQN